MVTCYYCYYSTMQRIINMSILFCLFHDEHFVGNAPGTPNRGWCKTKLCTRWTNCTSSVRMTVRWSRRVLTAVKTTTFDIVGLRFSAPSGSTLQHYCVVVLRALPVRFQLVVHCRLRRHFDFEPARSLTVVVPLSIHQESPFNWDRKCASQSLMTNAYWPPRRFFVPAADP